MFLEAFRRLRLVSVEVSLPRPNDPRQRTAKDFAFKIHDLAGDLERVVVSPHDHDDDSDNGGFVGDDYGSLDGSGSDYDSNGGAPPVVTTSS
jgi:hypothetical protein